MKTRSPLLQKVGLIAFLAATLWSSSALARGVVVVNRGEDYFETGPIPPPLDKEPELEGWTAGYKCSIFGVFWMYMAWWDCKPVAFKDDKYIDEPVVVTALEAAYKPSDMKVGFWKGYMRWVLAGAILLGIAVMVKGALSKKKTEESAEPEQKPSDSEPGSGASAG